MIPLLIFLIITGNFIYKKTARIPEGWEAGRVINFELYENNLVTQSLKKQKKASKRELSLITKNIIKKESDNKKELYKEYIMQLYSEFIKGNYYSVSEFHKNNNIQVSRMTLTNYWKKWIPEYKENSKEGNRFRI